MGDIEGFADSLNLVILSEDTEIGHRKCPLWMRHIFTFSVLDTIPRATVNIERTKTAIAIALDEIIA